MFSKQAGQKVPVLCVVDNGHGMTYAQMMRMVSFGHKGPNEHCQDQIGRFGIGFKVNIHVKILSNGVIVMLFWVPDHCCDPYYQ